MRARAPSAGGWTVWLAGLVVAVAAGAATAHGLFEVALGSGTPAGIAWLYPVITDGLALVAYAATGRLAGPGRRYAWAVVVLAAGLSGLAQATYLAGSVGTAPPGLRFGVGAWPAVAAAIAAHLLFLIGSSRASTPSCSEDGIGGTDRDIERRSTSTVPTVPSVAPDSRGFPSPDGETGRLALVRSADTGRSCGPVQPLSQADRAREVAQRHAARTGALPSVRELADLAQVGRGTADRALTALRATDNGAEEPPNTSKEDHDQ